MFKIMTLLAICGFANVASANSEVLTDEQKLSLVLSSPELSTAKQSGRSLKHLTMERVDVSSTEVLLVYSKKNGVVGVSQETNLRNISNACMISAQVTSNGSERKVSLEGPVCLE